MDYVGDFAPIKDSFLQIINTFNIILSEIGSSSDQISSGAKQISETSASLASGAAQQVAAVEHLSNIFEVTSQQTHKNTEDANSANVLASSAQETALEGKKCIYY